MSGADPTLSSAPDSSARLPLVLACFFLSGFAALLYETVWTQEFAFVFGTSELAVATVLAAYMAGLALGAGISGRLADRIVNPIRVYGFLELAIALAALGVPLAVRLSQIVLAAIFGGHATLPDQDEPGAAIFAALCSFAILIVPTALMGATLPLLARHAVRREEDIAGHVGLLYAVNTAGAVGGTLVAAFVLLPRIGLTRTVVVGALVNVAVFACAALLATRSAPLAPTPAAASPPPAHPRDSVWALVFLAGVASFTYEVLWTRLLGQILGGSVYAFATMLASFLIGIALGSAVASRLGRTRARAARGLVLAQLGAALGALLAFAGVDALPALARTLGAGGRDTALLANAGLAITVLLPGALCIGATFPLAVRVSAIDERDASAASGRIFAWNTFGAIVGAIGAGFFGIPLLGFAGLLGLAVAMNIAVSAGALRLVPPPRRLTALAVLVVAALALFARPTTPWRLVRASPLGAPARGEVAYYAPGRTATVLLLDHGTSWQLRTNGLPEASIQRPGGRPARYKLAAWLGGLPVLARPEARSMLVIGLGGGLALESVPDSIETIDVIELEPHVVNANRAIGAARRHDPLMDPRLALSVNDARGALLLTEQRWDAIVSQPSHPWTAGSSHLYTREFFRVARDHLNDDGVFVQWIGLAFVDEPLLRSLLSTLLDVFPHVRVYRPVGAGALFLASNAPLDVEATAERALAAAPGILGEIGVLTPEDSAAALALDEDGARSFAADAPLNTDDRNRLAARSPRLGNAALGGAGTSAVLDPLYPAPRPDGVLDPVHLVRRLIESRDPAVAERIAQQIRDPARRAASRGFVALARGRVEEAEQHFDAAIAENAALESAYAGRALLRRRLGQAPGSTRALPAGVRSVASAWRFEDRRNWPAVRRLERDLANVDPRHPLYREAVRLRVRWRLEAGGADRAREALALLDPVLAQRGNADALLLRARAANAAGYPWAAMGDVAEATGPGIARRPAFARRAIDALRAIPVEGGLANERDKLLTRLKRAID